VLLPRDNLLSTKTEVAFIQGQIIQASLSPDVPTRNYNYDGPHGTEHRQNFITWSFIQNSVIIHNYIFFLTYLEFI
jgi:hypothetical protein